MTILEIVELARIKREQEQKELGIKSLIMLNNIRNGAMLSVPNQKAQRQAKQHAIELFKDYNRFINSTENNNDENVIDHGGILK